MRNFTLLSLMFILSVGLNSCTKECEEWYEGDDCKTEVRAKFFGVYAGTATTNGQSANAQTQVSTSTSGINSFSISLTTGEITATLSSKEGTFSIPLQNIYYQGTTSQIEGSGSFNGNQMIMNYIWSFQGVNYTINFTGTK